MKFLSFFVLSALSLLGFVDNVEAKDLYAAIGDSITAAARAATTVGGYADPVLEEAKLKPQPERPRPKDYRTMYSWATGQKIFSQYRFLFESKYPQCQSEKELGFLNVAESGNSAKDIEGQAVKVVEALSSGEFHSLAYVSILIGANDLCNLKMPNGSTPNDVFKSEMMKAIEVFSYVRQKEPVKILIVGIPNVPDLGRPEIKNAHVTKHLTCNRIREALLIEKACKHVLDWGTSEEYQKSVQLVQEKNEVLKQVVQEANAKFPSLKLAYSDALFKERLELGDLAADCFHPNRRGQQIISFRAWESQPWF